MADRIVVMKDGEIRQVATPAEAYHHPRDTFVAQFIGAPVDEHAARQPVESEGEALTLRLWDGSRARACRRGAGGRGRGRRSSSACGPRISCPTAAADDGAARGR